MTQSPDVVIVGGGLVGASLAAALEFSGARLGLGLRVAVVEAFAPDAEAQPSFDERTIALTDNARRIYTDLGLWSEIAPHAEPIREIHVSDRGHFGMTHLRPSDAGVGGALGYVVASRILGRVLHRHLNRSAAVSLLCPATAEQLIQRERVAEVGISHNGKRGKRTKMEAPLVVLADGGRSPLAGQLGLQPDGGGSAYRQSAILSVVETDRAHRGRAFERFTGEGPLALLPHSERRYAVVWTTGAERLAPRLALSDSDFVAELQRVFGDRAGHFSRPSARKCYPLRYRRMKNPVGQRVAIIGNAAHSVHPVAGQGFNLGLRDAAVLAEVITRARRQGRDIGGSAVLGEYAALRRRETVRVSLFTDGLIRLFGSRRKTIQLARNLALAGIELSPTAKRLLLRRTMGLAGKPSRLGSVLPVVPDGEG